MSLTDRASKAKDGSLKASALTIGSLLVVAGGEALTSGEYVVGVVLLGAGLGGYGAHELLDRRQFAFEDDLAGLIEDNEALAREFETFVRENADDLDLSELDAEFYSGGD